MYLLDTGKRLGHFNPRAHEGTTNEVRLVHNGQAISIHVPMRARL